MNKMIEKFKKKGRIGERANEDARFVLPQTAETKIVVTMNCRELFHLFKQRCCSRAQWEIRNLANKMLGRKVQELTGELTHVKGCPR